MRGSVAVTRRPVLLASAALVVLAGLFAAGFASARHGGGQGGAPVAR